VTVQAADRLYELLPALYRERDEVEGQGALRALLELVSEQVRLVEDDIDGLWDNLFVETAAEWVIPYIGDLVGNESLRETESDKGRTATELFDDLVGPDLRPPSPVRARADVAKTISYRRRKGTLPMLEELARDVTGWDAHAVEFFTLLGWTQNLNHLRPRATWTDLRSVERIDRVATAFDEATHTVDVRPLGQRDGWFDIPNIGLFLWRLGSYPLANVPARVSSEPWRFYVSPLGNRAPLFAHRRREGSITRLATELDVGGPIRRAFFWDDLRRYATLAAPRPDHTDLYGLPETLPALGIGSCPDCSVFVVVDGQAVRPEDVRCRRLRPWPAAQPGGSTVAIDVVEGRLALGSGLAGPGGEPAPVDVWFHYGFPAGLGGGSYDRSRWVVRPDRAGVRLRVRSGVAADPTNRLFPSVEDALTHWETVDHRPPATIEILDSRTYALPAVVTLRTRGRLTIEAADGERPLLLARPRLEVDVDPPANADDPRREAELTLSGVVVEGFIVVVGDLRRLRILHSTLIPGRFLGPDGDGRTSGSSVRARASKGSDTINAVLRVELAYSIAGPLVLPEQAEELVVLDSIVDGFGGSAVRGPRGVPGPQLRVERSTLLGTTSVRSLDASETIFTDTTTAVRTQEGCVRFSYVTLDSRTPRRYRCQPDLAAEAAVAAARAEDPRADPTPIRQRVQGWLVPAFRSRRYGSPAYCQLHVACPREIAAGGDDDAEMGVFNHVEQHRRLANLDLRLREYLPFGLEAGPILVT
jgi:hypothetical protein